MRRLLPHRFAAYLVCGILSATAPLAAQEGRAKVGDAPSASEREPRPQAERLHVEAMTPEMEGLLEEWYNKTNGITKLQGKHHRYMYERTFFSASVAAGRFYYEAPDKGRIDIESAKPAKDLDPETEGIQISDETGNIYKYTDCPKQSWICDGQRVMEVNHEAKTFDAMPIPESQQGANIMDGPLPFLFGLPPDKAKARYHMKIDANLTNDQMVGVVVKPLLRQDASNWSEARVILFRNSFLPYAVKLISQNGISSTVYVFSEHEVNNFNILQVFGVHPFKPPALYAQVQSQPAGAMKPLQADGKAKEGMPSVVGLSYPQASTVLAAHEIQQVHVVPTTTPCEPNMRHKVKSQNPPPGEVLNPSQPVQLVLWASQEDIDLYNAKQRQRTAQK